MDIRPNLKFLVTLDDAEGRFFLQRSRLLQITAIF